MINKKKRERGIYPAPLLKNKSGAGFTLVELLVGIAVFTLIVGGVVNLLSSTFAAQRQSLASQELVGQSSFVAEFMSRALRQAQKQFDPPPACLSAIGVNYEIISSPGPGIKFIDEDGNCREFYAQGGKIIQRNGVTVSDLTSDDLNVQILQFYIQGETQSDDLQPRATFYMAIKGRNTSGPFIQLQSTISQRRYDVPE